MASSAAKIRALRSLAVAADTADTVVTASLSASARDLAVLADMICVCMNPAPSPARKWIVNTQRYRRSECVLIEGLKSALVWCPVSMVQSVVSGSPALGAAILPCHSYGSVITVFVCVFFPLILDIKFVGRTSRGHTGG
ncbi:unnamed protein product, partial [Ascophyllum nodosum]